LKSIEINDKFSSKYIKLRIQKKNVWKKWCLQHASHFTRSIKYSQCHPNDNPIIRKKEPKHEKLNLKYI
jgi:hypothetical protein